MWRLLRVSCGAFLDLFFLGDTLLEDSFKGGHHFFLWASRPKTYTIRPKIQGLNPILLDPKYKTQNKFYTTPYNFYK